ncbi:MAG: zf-HC2 domain-containing protein [Anaerolineae bacterium]|nr:zf-HC2 domain-containing protein [Anaerolineae bacterium]MDH7473592.1 zf-HC2 domain-containing protein [Anaerolineae bacterium]
MPALKACPQFSEQMSLALDKQLSAREENELRAHLRTCDACRAQWDALQEIERLFATAPLISPPACFAVRVSARLAERESRRQIIFGVLALVIGAVVLGLISLASLGEVAPALYLLVTTPAAGHGLTVVTELLSTLESVLNALWLLAVACVRSPAAMICTTYSLIILALNVLWLRVLTSRLLRPVSHRA